MCCRRFFFCPKVRQKSENVTCRLTCGREKECILRSEKKHAGVAQWKTRRSEGPEAAGLGPVTPAQNYRRRPQQERRSVYAASMYTKHLPPGISYRCFCSGTMPILRYFLSPAPAGHSGIYDSIRIQCPGRLYRCKPSAILGIQTTSFREFRHALVFWR